VTLKEFFAQFSDKLQKEARIQVAMAKIKSHVEGPIKAIELLVTLIQRDPEMPWIELIELAVERGEIEELEYVLPGSISVKSIFFPCGTELRT